MIFTIHRGAAEIGGSCVEVCTAATRIVIDIGMPLVNPDGSEFDSKKISGLSAEELRKEKILPAIPVLYDSVDNKETALLISHSHLDHYGLVSFVSRKIQVYLGEATHKLIELSGVFAGKKEEIETPRYFKSYSPFTFGDIEITPYIVDHAAFDAYAFLIRGEGKSLLYTGDFRSHGRKHKYFYKFLRVVPKNVDWLLMEGTSLSRKEEKFPTEEELEIQFTKTFKETQGINMVYVSGQNVDRLVTVFRSCKRSRKLFVIDFYIAAVLSELAALGYGIPYPSPDFSNIKVFFPNLLRRKMEKLNRKDLIERFKKYEITPEEIDKNANNIVMTVRSSMNYEIKKIKDLTGSTLVYSMWEGYREKPYMDKFLANLEKRGAKITTIHTSGHADYPALQKMLDTIMPVELVPIHTMEGKKYKEIFPESNVKQVNNGEAAG